MEDSDWSTPEGTYIHYYFNSKFNQIFVFGLKMLVQTGKNLEKCQLDFFLFTFNFLKTILNQDPGKIKKSP